MKNTIINSTLALSTAFLLTIILHELAHYLMAIFLNYEATLYHNMVAFKTPENEFHEIMIAGIAPIFSLLQGVLAYQYSKRMKTSPESLLVLWFGLVGMITFFGYLMIAPLVPVGDTGKVFSLLHVPISIQLFVSIVAVVSITFILMKCTVEFEKYALQDFGNVRMNRKKWGLSLLLFPLLLSIFITTLLQFPVQHFASILATVCAPLSILAVVGTFMGSKEALQKNIEGKSVDDSIWVLGLVLFFLMVGLNRVLVEGM